jgi:hypothetical protein
MSKRSPDLNQQDAGQASSERPRRANRKPAEAQQYIGFLPDGKGGARVRKGSVPLEVDVEAHIEERTDCEPGLYRIERKRGGEFSGEVFFYTKEEDSERGLDLDRFTDEDDGSMPQLEEVRASGTLDAASMAKLVSATVNATLDARERMQRAEQGQPSTLDMMRQLEEMNERRRVAMREEMREMFQQNPVTQPGAQLDPETNASVYFMKQTGALKEMMRGVRDVITSPDRIDEPQSMMDKGLGFVRDLLENPYIGQVAGPVIANKLVAVLQHVAAGTLAQHVNSQAAPQPQQRPTPEAQTAPMPQTTVAAPEQQREGDDAPITIDIVLANIITDIQHDEVPDDCVDDVVRLATEDPKWQPALAQILELPNVELLKTLKDAKGIDLSPLNNAGKFLDGLRKGVKSRIKLQAPPTAQEAASNGNGTAASLKTA